MDSLPEISLGTAALIIFGCCAIYLFLRGLARTFINTALLAVSAAVGFWLWQNAPSLTLQWTEEPSPILFIAIPAAGFLLTYLILRKAIGLFRAPLPRISEETTPKSKFQLLSRLLLALIPAAALCIIAALAINHFGAISEIENYAENKSPTSEHPTTTSNLRETLTSFIPPEILEKFDPSSASDQITTAKSLIAKFQNRETPANLSPHNITQIINEHPDLIDLIKDGHYSTLLRHPALAEAVKSSRN